MRGPPSAAGCETSRDGAPAEAISAPRKGLAGVAHALPVTRTARETLNELKWRRGLDLARAEIGIADRTRPGGGRVLSGAEIVSLGHRYFTTARATIPFYKILKITYGEKVLFERRGSR